MLRLAACAALLAAVFGMVSRVAVSSAEPVVNAPADKHWAFVPPQRPAVPESVGSALLIRNPVDAFIASKQVEAGLSASPEADRATLLRRATLALTGLPPVPEETEAFLADRGPGAYERVVERLLDSPRYGERWGRFWLDLARWAESDGYEHNSLRAHAWRYRDYVVRAFNADKPYDLFLKEQIAGDEMAPYSDERLVATGFLAAARNNNNQEDKVEQLNESIVDIANTTASVTLGLTLSCAQCHDHKFEPLTIRDYYAWHGYFLRGQVNSLLLQDLAENEAWKKTLPPELETSRLLLAQLSESGRKKLPPEEKAGSNAELTDEQLKKVFGEDDQKLFGELKKKVKKMDAEASERRPQTWGYYSPATSPHAVENLPPRGQYPFEYNPEKLKKAQPRVLKRGSVFSPGAELDLAVPAVLFAAEADSPPRTRLELADWLASAKNPLTARVWVNYLWQQHFGRGLVETAGDFGVKGAKPSHPELLDWLACELRENGWSTKRIHRLIMLSSTYRQDSKAQTELLAKDPENRLLWRWTPRRLEAEALRDSWLAVAGRLNPAMGGPSLKETGAQDRRSLYQRQHRYLLPDNQMIFDAPTSNETCPLRHVSTVPLQPLYLLNNAQSVKTAERFAARVNSEAGADRARQITRAFELALARPPEASEQAAAVDFFASAGSAGSGEGDAALNHFCLAVLNLNEVNYLP